MNNASLPRRSALRRLPMLTVAAGLLFAAAAPLPAAELMVDGMFATTAPLPANSYSQAVGRQSSSAAIALTGTSSATGTNATAGWQTTESDGNFEVWTPGFTTQGITPNNADNNLELANNKSGTTVFQNVQSSVSGGTQGYFSFFYASRDSGNDKFTLTITDLSRTATSLVSQQFNPTLHTFTQFTANFTNLTAGDIYQVSFLDQNTSANGTQSAHIEDVSFIQAPIPEPATWLGAALLLGGAGFAARRRFGQRATA